MNGKGKTTKIFNFNFCLITFDKICDSIFFFLGRCVVMVMELLG